MANDISLLWNEIEQLKQKIASTWQLTYDQYGSWTDWTPVVTQGVAVTVSPIFCRYSKIGSTVILQARLYVSTAGTAGNAITISGLPTTVQPANTPCVIGTAMVLKVGSMWYTGSLYAEGADSLKIQISGYTNALGITPSIALTLYDQCWLVGNFER